MADATPSTGLTMLYPSAGLSSYDKAQDLVDYMAAGLGLSPVVAFADNSHDLSGISDDNSSVPFSPFSYSCYHWWGMAGDGTRIGALYNQNDELVEIRAWQPWVTGYPSTGLIGNDSGGVRIDWVEAIGGLSAPDRDHISSTAASLVSSLGIPRELIADVSESVPSELTIVESGQIVLFTEVTLTSKLGGLSIQGANTVVVRFIDLNVSSIDLFTFYGASELSVISNKRAVSEASSFIQSALPGSDVAVLDGPWFSGYGLDQDTLRVVCIVGATIEISAWSNPGGAVVLVDAQTGSAVGYRLFAGMHDILRPHATSIPLAGVVAAALILVVGVALFFVWPPEVLIVLVLSLLAPLYSRLRHHDVLDHYKRGVIHGYIIANPGASFTEIRKALSAANGTLVYHLGVLERAGYVTSSRVGNSMRYYDRDVSLPDVTVNNRTELQLKIISHVNSCGECSKLKLRNAVGVTRQTLHYNLRRLTADHVLSSSFRNGRWHYRIAPGVDPDSLAHCSDGIRTSVSLNGAAPDHDRTRGRTAR